MIKVPGSGSKSPIHSVIWRLCSLLVLLPVPSLSIAPTTLKKPKQWWCDREGCRIAERSLGKPFPFFTFWSYGTYGQTFIWKSSVRKYWYLWTVRNILHFKPNQFNVIVIFHFLKLFLVSLSTIFFQPSLFFCSPSNSCPWCLAASHCGHSRDRQFLFCR